MKNTIYFYLVLVFLPFHLFSQTKALIEIENTSSMERKETVLAIKWETITKSFPKIDTANFVVINSITKKQIPYQLEHGGEVAVQNLLIQVNVKAKSKLQLIIEKGKPDIFSTKTYARYIPERKDDFAWENDKIAFRTYGKAIEGSSEDAYGFDVWVKRTSRMVINERYKRGDYHIDHGDGMDYYHVGHSLGAGNMAPFVGDSVRYSANYHGWKILDNGPLRSTFQLLYDIWDAGGIKVKAVKTISLDSGSQLSCVKNSYSFNNGEHLPVVVGIIKRPKNGQISLDEKQGIIGYWEPGFDKDGTTGTGVILTTPVSTMWIDKLQILAATEVKNNEPIVYYTGAAWDKAAEITNAESWFNYLNNFYKQLKEPLIITVK